VDLPFTRALYPPGGERLGKNPTVATTTSTAPSSIPSSRVAGTATPSSSAQAQHTLTQEAQVEGTDHVHVLIDDDVPVWRKRKLKSDVW
jgi:hypothetical protein